MKQTKLLIVTLVDGSEIKRNVTYDKIAPIGAPANAPEYVAYCAGIAGMGFNHELSGEKHFRFIAPSQIKEVSVKFIEE